MQPHKNLSFVKSSSNSKHQTQFSHTEKWKGVQLKPIAPQIFHSVLFTHFFCSFFGFWFFCIKSAKETKHRNQKKNETLLCVLNSDFCAKHLAPVAPVENGGLLAQLSSANAFSVFHSQSAKELKSEAQKAIATQQQLQSIFTLLFRAISSKLDGARPLLQIVTTKPPSPDAQLVAVLVP